VPRYLEEQSAPTTTIAHPAETKEYFGRVTEATKIAETEDTRVADVSTPHLVSQPSPKKCHPTVASLHAIDKTGLRKCKIIEISRRKSAASFSSYHVNGIIISHSKTKEVSAVKILMFAPVPSPRYGETSAGTRASIRIFTVAIHLLLFVRQRSIVQFPLLLENHLFNGSYKCHRPPRENIIAIDHIHFAGASILVALSLEKGRTYFLQKKKFRASTTSA
jgi:hypothetical protein